MRRSGGTSGEAATALRGARVGVPAPRPAEPGQRLSVPPDSLVVLAGLPGAGKTTLLRRLAAARPSRVCVLDSEDVAAGLRRLRLPYRVLRPAVHLVHLVRVVRAARHPAACVLTTDPMTSPLRRALLAAAARATGRTVHLVVLDATPEEAVHGQHERGRTLGRRRMARHVRRWTDLRKRLDRPGTLPLVASAVVVPRAQAGLVARVVVQPTPKPPSVAVLPGLPRSRRG